MTNHETDRPAAVPPPMSRAAKAEALLLRFTAEAHRRKWNYDRGLDGDGVPVKSEAFDALHRLGEEMRVALEELRRMPAAVSVPPPAPRAADQTALRDRIADALARLDAEKWGVEIPAKDHPFWQMYPTQADAVLAVLPEPADRAAVLREAAEALGRMDYDTDSHDYGYDTYRDAWNGGVMDGADLLRRLADEAAVVPPPALTEEGRLRAQVEVLQQDAERDRGLAKVGARCMREGHQGLIEQGRLVLEGWRFALSTALDLGTGAPWEAIHERVKELCPAAAVSGPCVAGEQQNETPEARRCVCPHPADEHSVYGCVDGCGCEWMPKRPKLPPMDPVHILGIEVPE